MGKLNFDEDEEDVPMFKFAMMTASAKHLWNNHVGKGVTPAEPEEADAARYGPGYRLLTKAVGESNFPRMQQGIAKLTGPRLENETQEEFMARATQTNRPVINSAVAWGSAAQKRAHKHLRQLAQDREKSQSGPELKFNQGEAVAGSADAYGILDAQGRHIDMSDEEGKAPDPTQVEPKPDMTTAFDATVWPPIGDQTQLSTGELQAAVENATKTEPEAEGAESEADFDPPEVDL